MFFITFLPFSKIRRVEKFNFNSTRLSNSSLFQKDIRQDICIALVGLLHYMGVNIGRGADLGVSQPFGNTHTVHHIEVQHRGHCMPEGMSVNVWESAALAELLEIVGYAVRVHGLAVVLGEYEVLILVVLPQSQPFLRLPCPIPPE